MSHKVHYDAQAYYGRLRTACGAATAPRTIEHDKVTCAQCLCTKAYKTTPRTMIVGRTVPQERIDALLAVLEAARPFANLISTWGDHKRALQQAIDAADKAWPAKGATQ